MANLTTVNKISIAELAVYTPALAIAFLLSWRHGFGRNAGWLYLIIFSVARLLGAALQLATIDQPTNTGLLTGAATLQNVGLSPLLLTALGLLGRVIESARHGSGSAELLPSPRILRLVQTVVLVGLILGIVGGVKLGVKVSDAAADAARTGRPFAYPPTPTESTAGLALLVAGFGLLAGATALCALHVRSAERGERRLLGAVAAALPFILVRVIYSCMSTFANNPDFRQFGGSGGDTAASYLIGMAVVMEMVAVAIFEGVGLTLRRIPKGERKTVDANIPMGRYGGRRRREGRRVAAYEGQESGVSHHV
jgi:hypothetical protein